MSTASRGADRRAQSEAGKAFVRAVRVGGDTVLMHVRANSPLHLLTPRADRSIAWLVTATFGGGLVGGDEVALELELEPGARVLLTSQASTKVYRSPAGTRQALQARVADEAMLAVLPDPIVAFAGSRFEQRQQFQLQGRANLIALDWMTSGRHARGEHWQFNRYASRIEIEHDGRAIFYDRLLLDEIDGSVGNRMRAVTTYGLLVMLGPLFQTLAAELTAAIVSQPAASETDPLISVASIDDGRGVALRFASRDVERAAAALRGMLRPLIPALGDDPWARKGVA